MSSSEYLTRKLSKMLCSSDFVNILVFVLVVGCGWVRLVNVHIFFPSYFSAFRINRVE